MKFLLIGNYPPDAQQSMERFARMLESGYRGRGIDVALIRPWVVFGRLAKSTTSGFGKWLGYLDKWVVFPMVLRWHRLRHRNAWYHVCDHSNAPYLAHLPAERASITCHDVLAIRGAFGHADAWCRASRFGVILQKWILGNLVRAKRLACVSELTLKQLRELSGPVEPDARWTVIPNAFNADFRPLSKEESDPLLRAAGVDPDHPYLLHVGSGLPRKNRRLLVDMLAALDGDWAGKLCLAGAPIDPDLQSHIEALGLRDRVISCPRPDHATLLALYGRCAAFVFPSYSEGFGWPVIEAQACGAPVLASDIEPMPEVSGGAAIHVSPDDPAGFARAFLHLGDPAVKDDLIRRGFENCRRFAPDLMISKYFELMRPAKP